MEWGEAIRVKCLNICTMRNKRLHCVFLSLTHATHVQRLGSSCRYVIHQVREPVEQRRELSFVTKNRINGSITATSVDRSRPAVVVLVLLPYHHLPILVSLHNPSIYSWTHCVLVRVKTFLVSLAGHSILLRHARCKRVVGDSHSVSPVVLHLADCALTCSLMAAFCVS